MLSFFITTIVFHDKYIGFFLMNTMWLKLIESFKIFNLFYSIHFYHVLKWLKVNTTM